MNDRIKKLLEQSISAEETISIERARLLTEFFSSGLADQSSVPVARTKAFKYILEHKELYLGEDELIVGERGPLPKATPTYPELCTHSLEDFDILHTRDKISFKVDEEVKKYQFEEVMPFWNGRSINAYYGLAGRLRRRAWEAICGGDLLFKMICRTLPYETTRGDTEDALERAARRAEELVASKRMRWPVFLEKAQADFLRIPTQPERRPLVGVVGEIYVRCNPFANSRVVEAIEGLGGEAWLSPVSEWILYTAWVERYPPVSRVSGRSRLSACWRSGGISRARRGPWRGASSLCSGTGPSPPWTRSWGPAARCSPPEFQGESVVTVGRAILFGEAGAGLVVNCAPFGCMHGNVTSAVLEQAGGLTRVPVVNRSWLQSHPRSDGRGLYTG